MATPLSDTLCPRYWTSCCRNLHVEASAQPVVSELLKVGQMIRERASEYNDMGCPGTHLGRASLGLCHPGRLSAWERRRSAFRRVWSSGLQAFFQRTIQAGFCFGSCGQSLICFVPIVPIVDLHHVLILRGNYGSCCRAKSCRVRQCDQVHFI